MKRFLFTVPVVSAEGTQTWYADAENSDEALEKYSRGECSIYSSEVEVVELGAPELAGETTLDDSGDPPPQRKPQQDDVIYLLGALNDIASDTYDEWTNGANAKRTAIAAIDRYERAHGIKEKNT